jgi:hypothetical protein
VQKTVHFFSEIVATDPELVELVSPLVPDCPPELRRAIVAGIKRTIRHGADSKKG